MLTTDLTPLQRLAEHLIGEPIPGWIEKRRGEGVSWRKMSLELRDRTDGQVDVTAQCLIRWSERAA